jgi:hypothetical protein
MTEHATKKCLGCSYEVHFDHQTNKFPIGDHVRGSFNHRVPNKTSCEECGAMFPADFDGAIEFCNHSNTEHPELALNEHKICGIYGCELRFPGWALAQHRATMHPLLYPLPIMPNPPPKVNNPAHPLNPDHVPNPLLSQNVISGPQQHPPPHQGQASSSSQGGQHHPDLQHPQPSSSSQTGSSGRGRGSGRSNRGGKP